MEYFGGFFSRVVLDGNKIYRGPQYTPNYGSIRENLSEAIQSSMEKKHKEVTADCSIGNNNGLGYHTKITLIKGFDDQYNISISLCGEISPCGLISFHCPNEKMLIIDKIQSLFKERSLPNLVIENNIENNIDNIVVGLVVKFDFKNIDKCFTALVDALVSVKNNCT